MTATSVLRFEHVFHAYEGGEEVLHDVNLSIEPGEIFCLLGPSGCGKTTSLRLAAGLEECQRGRILINGTTVADGRINVPPEERGVGLVFQDTALFPHLSVRDNIGFGIRDLNTAQRTARVNALLEQVGMTHFARAFPHMLSGGQQQRVALARALAPDPKLVLLDEPFSGLDAQLRSMVREETLAILHEHGATALVVTHDPEEAMYVADRIAVMHRGRIEQLGRPDEIYCNPVSPFVTGFFSSTNRFEGTVRDGGVASPFGRIPAPGDLVDGTPVQVLIRPEALRIGPRDRAGDIGAIEAHVMNVRMLRRAVFMRLCLGDFGGQHIHFHARQPGHHMPAEGSHVSVTLDPEQTFVFRASQGAGAAD